MSQQLSQIFKDVFQRTAYTSQTSSLCSNAYLTDLDVNLFRTKIGMLLY